MTNDQQQHTHENEGAPRRAAFNPKEHIMQLKNKDGMIDYLPVQWRLVWFREACPLGTIETHELLVDLDRECEAEGYAWNAEKRRSEKVIKRAKGYARFRAIVTDGLGGRATGTKTECAASFSDYVEKAETGAIGRALAALGYGTQFAPELNEGDVRLVDSPVMRPADRAPASAEAAPVAAGAVTQPTKEQIATIVAMCQRLGRPVTIAQSQREAQELIAVLTAAQHEAVRRAGDEIAVGDTGPVTEQQWTAIVRMCEQLGKSVPEPETLKSFLDAKRVITALSDESNQRRRAASAAGRQQKAG